VLYQGVSTEQVSHGRAKRKACVILCNWSGVKGKPAWKKELIYTQRRKSGSQDNGQTAGEESLSRRGDTSRADVKAEKGGGGIRTC